jgi:hypothetical protein
MPVLRARARNRAHDRCLLRIEHDYDQEHEHEAYSGFVTCEEPSSLVPRSVGMSQGDR